MRQKRTELPRDHLSLDEARRIALAAQVIDRPRPRGAVADALATEPRAMAAWLGLDFVVVERRTSFARVLAAALRA